jgi:hypothetical protein
MPAGLPEANPIRAKLIPSNITELQLQMSKLVQERDLWRKKYTEMRYTSDMLENAARNFYSISYNMNRMKMAHGWDKPLTDDELAKWETLSEQQKMTFKNLSPDETVKWKSYGNKIFQLRNLWDTAYKFIEKTESELKKELLAMGIEDVPDLTDLCIKPE